MMRALEELFQSTPLAFAIVAAFTCGLVTSIVGFVLAASRARRLRRLGARAHDLERVTQPRPFSPMVEILVVLPPILVMAAFVLASASARTMTLRALTETDPSQKVTLLATGVSANMGATFFAPACLVLLFPLVAVALGLLLAHRFRWQGIVRAIELCNAPHQDAEAVRAWAAHPGPRMLSVVSLSAGVGLAAAILAYGFLRYSLMLTQAFAALAGVDPADKAKLLLYAFATVNRSTSVTMIVAAATATAVALATAVVVLRAPAATRRRRLAAGLVERPALSWPAALWIAGPLLAITLVSVVVARPYRRAYLQPLPVSRTGRILSLSNAITLPPLRGSERLERAPLLEIGPKHVTLDSQLLTAPDQLADQLRRMNQRWQLINQRVDPGRRREARLVLVADKNIAMSKVIRSLGAALDADYPLVSLAFARAKAIESPLFGKIPTQEESAATLHLTRGTDSTAASSDVLRLSPPPEQRYGQFAKAVVDARSTASPRRVELVLPASDTPPTP